MERLREPAFRCEHREEHPGNGGPVLAAGWSHTNAAAETHRRLHFGRAACAGKAGLHGNEASWLTLLRCSVLLPPPRGGWVSEAAGRTIQVGKGPSVLKAGVLRWSAGVFFSFLSGQKALAEFVAPVYRPWSHSCHSAH